VVNNRSVPTDTLLPHLTYRNVATAVEWLTRVFGFVEHFRYGNPDKPDGAQMRVGDGWIMVHGPRESTRPPADVGFCTQSLSVYVEDVDAHFAGVTAQGATIVEGVHETVYGERLYNVVDLDGHRWEFSQHVKDLNPEEWGAKIANR
jgi:uncharacterized glyoxalase superfamily protein PhnB